MSSINCEACDNLRNTSPEYVQNGVTDTICASLQNDTGLNPSLSTLHDDATDMHNINDCTIGRMTQELEAYDVCDWKEFMKKFLPNLYEFNKAVNCVDAGQWDEIHDLWDYAKDLCNKFDSFMWPSTSPYGVFPYANPGAREIGTIPEIDGAPAIIFAPESDLSYPERACFGITYQKRQSISCSGVCRIYEWYNHSWYGAGLGPNTKIGDIVWYCDKETFMAATGCTEHFWNMTADKNVGWNVHGYMTNRSGVVMRTQIRDDGGMGPDYITIRYHAGSYPASDQRGLLFGSGGDADKSTQSSC